MLNGHGDDIYNHEREIVSNFSSNVYNKLNLAPLHTHLQASLLTIHSYPEPTGKTLAAKLAKKNGISEANICLTNGATEAIYTLAQAYRGVKSTIVIPTFSEYEDACRINEIDLQFVRSIYDVDEDTELLWVCNPNNPTGSALAREAMLAFAKAHPYITLIVDQSYGYFTKTEMLTAQDTVECKNIILLQSMTKQYAIPGLRLGYAIAHERIIDKMNLYRMPWSVNALALEAGKYLLDTDLSAQLNMDEYLAETKRFAEELAKIDSISVQATSTHFFLCKIENRIAAQLKEYLVKEHGILIRDASNFRGLNETYFRVATQSEDENNKLVKAIREWVK